MANKTTSSNVTQGDIISMTRKYSNTEDSSRIFDIECEAVINGNEITHFNNGSVKERGVLHSCASFSAFGDTQRHCSFSFSELTPEKSNEVMNAVHDFFNAVKADVETSKTKDDEQD